MESSHKISIIIVDFLKGDRVVENVKSALAQETTAEIEIIIIDNSCSKENFNKLKALESNQVKLIKSNKNLGYIQACNLGVSHSNSDFIFLVNPDIVWLEKDTITNILKEFDTAPNIGIIGTRQRNDDGTTPNTVRRFPDIIAQVSRRTFMRKIPWFAKRVSSYEMDDFDYSTSGNVEWMQSSFMVVRQELWNKIDGLDNRFFLFMADPDICYQAWENGFKVRYLANVCVGADGKRCSEGGFLSVFKSKAIRYHLKDAFNYELKYFSKEKKPSSIN